MGLLQNGFRHNLTARMFGATSLDGANPYAHVYWGHRAAANRNLLAGPAITESKVSVPSGNRHPVAWIMPRKSGGLSSRNQAIGSATASLTLVEGRNLSGTAEGVATASGTMGLIAGLSGTAAGAAIVTGALQAAYALSGTAAGTSAASAALSALGWLSGVAEGSSDATANPHALGHMSGSVTPFTELSPQNLAAAVWNSLLSQYQEAGSAGEALGMAGAGGVNYEALADAVLAALEATTIPVNLEKVRGQSIGGTGAPGDPWGPA